MPSTNKQRLHLNSANSGARYRLRQLQYNETPWCSKSHQSLLDGWPPSASQRGESESDNDLDCFPQGRAGDVLAHSPAVLQWRGSPKKGAGYASSHTRRRLVTFPMSQNHQMGHFQFLLLPFTHWLVAENTLDSRQGWKGESKNLYSYFTMRITAVCASDSRLKGLSSFLHNSNSSSLWKDKP
ncbi:unnamed protein product [Pleuronectes platessa]|uniref:Uncharacterized protein n=1 Tax=Pleuronectes platessa TaxID=8262 RepID=A0A9N7UZ64_PLEPL|nr:unnamed protein product [Pleuronectes platessa]